MCERGGAHGRAEVWASARGAWGAWVPLGEGWEIIQESAPLGESLATWPLNGGKQVSLCTVRIRLCRNIKPHSSQNKRGLFPPFILEAGSRACVTALGSSALPWALSSGSPPVPNTELSLEPLPWKAATGSWHRLSALVRAEGYPLLFPEQPSL